MCAAVAAAIAAGAGACHQALLVGGLSAEVHAAVVDLLSVLNAHAAHILDGRLRDVAPALYAAFRALARPSWPFIPRVLRAILGLSEDASTPIGVVVVPDAPAAAGAFQRSPWPVSRGRNPIV